MSMIETLTDVNNSFLSRREITCTFKGVGGKLKKLDAIEMIKKEFKLDGKVIIPIKMKNNTGNPSIMGTFYVYDDEKLAKQHVNPVIFSRLEKAKTSDQKSEPAPEEKPAESKAVEEKPVESKATDESKPSEEKS